MNQSEMQSYIEARCVPEPNTGCWLWLLSESSNGYGNASDGVRVRTAHRMSYEAFVGPIPVGAMITHRCNQRLCVNFDHLRPGDQKSNMDDVARGKYHPRRKLTTEQVCEVRRLRSDGATHRAIARIIGADPATVQMILAGKIYRYDHAA